ncbi:MAG: 4-hydroxy-3-methylbut-2-enyl diphosphate reductase [Chloroflexota bacterium]|nr:4-hydroxy-3-methylbut-2-enyl diphosphate reductase [Chloroflexota bacterium]
MEIRKAAELGFCTGVRRAIEMLEGAARESGPLVTLGPVVHNQRVTDRLNELGISAVDSIDQVSGGTVAISSHGVSPEVVERLESTGLRMIDTTCPFVRRTQVAAQKLASAGFFVVVFGDESHREVQGVLGWAAGGGVATREVPELREVPQRIGILSQTTQSYSGFSHFVSSFADSYLASISELRVINTICDATKRRQEAALELARGVDVMLVVGSQGSANTRRLTELCSRIVPTHLIGGAQEIDPGWLGEHQRIGVTAGASTPDDAIEEVIDSLAGADVMSGKE